MLGKLQTYKLQPTKFYEKGHRWDVITTFGPTVLSVGVAVTMKVG